ncbi:M20 metallopeptidase family protein [Membranihabitans maritimus]|uniref:M20 metallopeptidase family protein n=1 Tax=Membranihabitans maritimus TaxID=2904244 RepID=UPI001F1FA405|nr:M20 family metallopeptidase [Membranihabitans maritimus]
MSNISANISALNKTIKNDLIATRRYLHQHPELSFQEKETSKFVAGKLDDLGIPYKSNIGGYGIVAHIEGRDSGKTVALRADMDALPIEEKTNKPYASKVKGVMHACGHDVHTTSLLGVAKILMENKAEINGTVKLIFQPAEERLPGGASLMIKDGVLQNPKPDIVVGQHVHPPLEVGKVGFKSGMYMASTDELFLHVKGKGGHGALPHDCIDTTLATSHILVAMQQIISRRANPAKPTVLTFGKIASDGGSTNVIPEKVYVEGTFRAMDEKWRAQAHKLIKDTAMYTARALGAEVEVEIKKGYPYLFNDPETTERLKALAIDFLGGDNVVELPIQMTAEDFAYYTREAKSCFYRLGVGNVSKGIQSQLHSPTFDVDEDCFDISSGLMAYMAIEELKS